ncbi:MAG: hypothetical protein JSS69_11740 [Acidobacteria bacterium]|nr:hypothetical protein [Acidobacteriota bacterium]MBS1866575.1 hypothetical protein [Acidobacteriota bacterium]
MRSKITTLEAGICVGVGAQAKAAESGKWQWIHRRIFVKSAQAHERMGDELTGSAKEHGRAQECHATPGQFVWLSKERLCERRSLDECEKKEVKNGRNKVEERRSEAERLASGAILAKFDWPTGEEGTIYRVPTGSAWYWQVTHNSRMKNGSKQLSEEPDVVQVANFLGLVDEWTVAVVREGFLNRVHRGHREGDGDAND